MNEIKPTKLISFWPDWQISIFITSKENLPDTFAVFVFNFWRTDCDMGVCDFNSNSKLSGCIVVSQCCYNTTIGKYIWVQYDLNFKNKCKANIPN